VHKLKKQKQFGIDVTHLDSHMGALFSEPEFLKVLLKLGREYKLPVMLSKTGFRAAFNVNPDRCSLKKTYHWIIFIQQAQPIIKKEWKIIIPVFLNR
jgi:hypothetical protein